MLATEIIDHLAATPQSQADPSLLPRFAALHGKTAQEQYDLLDKIAGDSCEYGLVSDFMMKVFYTLLHQLEDELNIPHPDRWQGISL